MNIMSVESSDNSNNGVGGGNSDGGVNNYNIDGSDCTTATVAARQWCNGSSDSNCVTTVAAATA